MDEIEVEFTEMFDDEDIPAADDADFESVVTDAEPAAEVPAEEAPEETPVEETPDQEA